MKIGFIGLGIMGLPMARNLCRAGHELIVTDHHAEHIAAALSFGAREGTMRELASESDAVLTMLPNGPQVKDAVLGSGGAAEFMRSGSVLIDMSSIDPMVSREIASSLLERGIDMLDAPVSGGEPKAIDGTLAFMVGGKTEVFERFRPLLLAMGSSAVLCGGVGAGNTAKLANQIIVAANIAAVSEGLTLAKMAGVDPKLVFGAIRGGLAGSAVMDAKAPMMLRGDDRPGFRVDLHIKDLTNVISCADSLGMSVPVTGLVMDMLRDISASGFGRCDHSAIIHYYEKLTGESFAEIKEDSIP